MFRFLFLLVSLSAFAQQQIIPKELDRKQRKLFEELTQAVSAPCCQNGIPVAFHMSPMANAIRDEITAKILAGQSKAEIMDYLAEATYGEGQQKIIFTVPSKTFVGYLAYIVPALAALIGIGIIFFYRHRGREEDPLSDDELLATYKDTIMDRIGSSPSHR